MPRHRYVVSSIFTLLASTMATPAAGQAFDAKVNGNPTSFNNQFGREIDIDGSFMITGATGPNEFTGSFSGAAFIHQRLGPGDWVQEAHLTQPTPAPWDFFGWSVDLDGEVAIVGAPKRDGCGVGENCNTGAAYVFRRDQTGSWSLEQTLTASDPASGDEFGFDVAVEGELIVVSAPFDDDNGSTSGSAYVFRRDGGGVWTERAKIITSDGAVNDFFGQSIAISNGELAVGASGESGAFGATGAVYTFQDQGSDSWIETDKLVADDAFQDDQLGFDVDFDGDLIVAGAPLSDSSCQGLLCNGGAAYVFARDQQGDWSQEMRIFPDDVANSDFFGFAVGISGETVIASSVREDDEGNGAGAVYIFKRTAPGVWSELIKLTADDGQAGDELGYSAAIDGVIAVVGALRDDVACPGNPNCDSGSAYVWSLRQLGDAAPGDLDFNGAVNGADLANLISVWGTTGMGTGADINGDGVVNGADLATLLGNWTG